jgi:hypothetical protein
MSVPWYIDNQPRYGLPLLNCYGNDLKIKGRPALDVPLAIDQTVPNPIIRKEKLQHLNRTLSHTFGDCKLAEFWEF